MLARGTSQAASAAVGFLSIVQDPVAGYMGGYLLLNLRGQPLEFHCTTPVKPSRAQEILYGPTLEVYLCGELIAQALLAKATVEPWMVCTDNRAAAAAREFTKAPLALATGDSLPPGWTQLIAGHDSQWALAPHAHEETAPLVARFEALASSWDVSEPFERIREALAEAQRQGP